MNYLLVIFGGTIVFFKNRNKFLEHYFKKCRRVFNIKLLSAIFNNYDNSYNDRIRDSFYSYFGSDKYNNSEEDNMNQIQNFECKTFLQGYLNVEDKLSMANSLEAGSLLKMIYLNVSDES